MPLDALAKTKVGFNGQILGKVPVCCVKVHTGVFHYPYAAPDARIEFQKPEPIIARIVDEFYVGWSRGNPRRFAAISTWHSSSGISVSGVGTPLLRPAQGLHSY